MPALKLLTTPERAQLLSLAAKLIAADQRMTQAEFVVLAVLERRLGPQAGRSVPVRYANVAALRSEVCFTISGGAQPYSAKYRGGRVYARCLLCLSWNSVLQI